MFTRANGMPVTMDNFKRDLARLKALAKKKGLDLEGFTLHGIRARYATNQIRLGSDVKTVSEILGHHKASYTLDKYLKTDEATNRVAQDRLTDKLMEAKRQPSHWVPKELRQIQSKMVGGIGS